MIGYDPYFTPGEEFSFVEQVDLDDLMGRSDVISVHCPPEHAMDMFNKDAFARMKDTAYLINVARGGIVNEADLEVALTEGQIAGAALDCMENKPAAPGNPLFAHENLLVTPHMAWYSEEAADELNTKVAACTRRRGGLRRPRRPWPSPAASPSATPSTTWTNPEEDPCASASPSWSWAR